jgi:MFS family permease
MRLSSSHGSLQLTDRFVVLCGLGSGGFFTLQSSIVGQIIGSHRVSIGVAWLEVAMSFGNLAGPISAGALLDAFGGSNQGAGPYRPAIVSLVHSTSTILTVQYLVGATTAASALLVASIRYSTSRNIWGRV